MILILDKYVLGDTEEDVMSRRRRSRDTEEVFREPLRDLFNPITRPVQGLHRLDRLDRTALAAADERRYHPLAATLRPAAVVASPRSRVVVAPSSPGSRGLNRLAFSIPRDVVVCVRRKQRREVLHALRMAAYRDWETDRKSTRLNSSHSGESRMPSSA